MPHIHAIGIAVEISNLLMAFNSSVKWSLETNRSYAIDEDVD